MKTRTIDISRDAAHAAYFSAIAGYTKALRNTVNFLIRNTMTGIRKSPEERTHNETEALHLVFTGIQAANRKRRTPLPYPMPEKWMLTYYQLDAILEYAGDGNYRALPAQVNQQSIKEWLSHKISPIPPDSGTRAELCSAYLRHLKCLRKVPPSATKTPSEAAPLIRYDVCAQFCDSFVEKLLINRLHAE